MLWSKYDRDSISRQLSMPVTNLYKLDYDFFFRE